MSHQQEEFSIAFPEGWLLLSPETAADDEDFTALVALNPGAEQQLAQAREGVEGRAIDFFAIESAAGAVDGVAENVSIEILETSAPASALEDYFLGRIEEEIPTARDVESSILDIPAGDTVFVRYTHVVDAAQGSLEIVTVQYVVIGDGISGLLTFTSTPPTIAEYEDTFTDVTGTFGFGA